MPMVNRPAPTGSIVSLMSSPLGLLLVFLFAEFPTTRTIIPPRVAQLLLLAMLTIGVTLAISARLRREHPRWLALSSLLLLLGVTSMIGLCFLALDD